MNKPQIPECPLERVSSLLGGKWKIRLLWAVHKAGSARFSFAEDGTFTIANANGKTITSGTWTRTENDITMAFGRTLNLLTLKGIVAVTTTGCQLLFDADKFIGVLQMLSKFSGDSGTFSDIAAILDEVTGLKLGFDLVRAD